MCSIIGYCDTCTDIAAFTDGFMETVSRGPDDSRIVDTGHGLLGFHRLAIMGLTPEGMQPFRLGDSYVVCNGEIYGYEKCKAKLLEKGYSFRSGSDCEILLPLYKEYGVDMFRMLDAEYALILYDGETKQFIAARDPIGIRPLYYGYDKKGVIVFGSEPKNLVGMCGKVMPFPPGHYYKDGKFVCYDDITKVKQFCYDDLETVCTNIHDKLVAGVKKRLVADAKVGFLLSGGLDSSLVCAIAARESKTPIRTFAIGMREDAIDLKYARIVADYIGSDHTEVIMTKEQVLDALDFVIKMLGTFDITTIRASMGMYLMCKWIHENTDIRVLLTGEISDELRADRCISVNSLEARVPFGDLDFVRYVLAIDPAKKVNVYGKGKYLLRHAFEGDWLPHDILMREKAAFSDAVGHSMVDDLKAYAEQKYTDEEFETLRRKYDFAQPFTKESLLYRELFEQYYPGQAHMIVDFWMPNKSWAGCDVDDPSARVLANYGDSGK